MVKYLIRFDDITPNLSWKKFYSFKNFLEKKNIKCILAVVPFNKDKKLNVSKTNKNFFNFLKKCKDNGDTIAQHGYTHEYSTSNSGILKINDKSEFSGLGYTDQYKLLSKGKFLLKKKKIWEPIFVAPAHSFDDNTIYAAKKLGFKVFIDGFSLHPYKYKGIIFVPQFNYYSKFIFGTITLCIHINKIDNKEIKRLRNFISLNKDRFISLDTCLNNFTQEKIYQKFIRFLLQISFPIIRKIRKKILF